MLETIREYAASLDQGSDELKGLRGRHLRFYLALVEEAEPELTGRDQREWFERLVREQDNVREALSYACDSGDGENALMLAGTFWRFWWTHGPIDEAGRWCERAFAIGDDASETARARGLFGAAHVAEMRGDVELTRTLFERAADLLRRIGATRWLVLALTHLAGTYEDTDPGQAERIQLEALELAEEAGDRRGAAIVKGNLAEQLIAAGDFARASSLAREGLEGHRDLGDLYGMAACLASLAAVAVLNGDIEAAAAHIGESIRLSRSIGDKSSLSSELSIAAAVMLARGEADDVARLLAAIDALSTEYGFDLSRAATLLSRDTSRGARAILGERFDETWAAGVTLDLDAAVELALNDLECDQCRLHRL
jgi:tetratricopeptide (TPR) repeat protein